MHSALVRALLERRGLPELDADTLDAFLDQTPHGLIFFAGDPRARLESDDVAVAMPEILAAFPGRLRGGVIARAAEEALKARLHVVVMPSLVVTRGREVIEVVAKIRDWSEYLARVGAALAPDAAPMASGKGPQTTFKFGAGVEA